jgi:ATP-dependent Clp protease, protease subunit
MPIGVPRIIYCWGEEIPPQWTDIYNFIFRRRMVFLMQYLDDELCNQICGLLINIHMEDRSKELDAKEKSGVGSDNRSQKSSMFKSSGAGRNSQNKTSGISSTQMGQKPKTVEDLLTTHVAEDDLAIDQNHLAEQYTLQKITMEWLNWNAQFFDYSESNSGINGTNQNQAYLYYLADILSKDFTKDFGGSMYNLNKPNHFTSGAASLGSNFESLGQTDKQNMSKLFKLMLSMANSENPILKNSTSYTKTGLDVYSPFRYLANFASPEMAHSGNFTLNNPALKAKILEQFASGTNKQKTGVDKLLNDLAQQKLSNSFSTSNNMRNIQSSEKALGQRRLKREYLQDRIHKHVQKSISKDTSFDYNLFMQNGLDANQFSRKQNANQRSSSFGAELEEEAKKVFVVINSFGGSVGNGITVHDALQFIKAGSLTLGLGVAASAASLVLAGGTIGERYVTEGCHTMIHQPESGLNGQASDIWIDANEIMKIRLDVAEIYSLSTYRPRHKILRDLDRDFFLTATETIQYGLADEIATNEVMHSIIEMTNKAWDVHDAQQQRLLESRDITGPATDTQSQS